MIQLLNNLNHIYTGDIRILSDIDLLFLKVSNNLSFLTEADYSYLNQVDGVTKLDGDYIKTPFGSTTVNNLSTGMKTLLLLSYYHSLNKSIIMDLNGCGSNVLALIFTDKRYKDNTFFLTHESLPDIETHPFKVENIDRVFTNLSVYLDYKMDTELQTT